MPPLRRSHLSVVTVLALALMLLAACGEDKIDEADDSSPFTPTAASAQQETAASTPQTNDPPSQSAIEPTSTTQAQEPGGEMEPTATPESDAPVEPTPMLENPAPDNPAPELDSGGTWYNSEPLSLAELRGKPVLLVFWATY